MDNREVKFEAKELVPFLTRRGGYFGVRLKQRGLLIVRNHPKLDSDRFDGEENEMWMNGWTDEWADVKIGA